MQSQGYEFGAQENAVVSRTALWAKLLGAVVLAEGAFKLLQIVENPIGTILSVLLAVVIGLAFIRGGSGLSRVVDTEGDDVQHLMEGLSQLTRAFTIRIAVMLFVLGLVILAVLAVGCMTIAL